MKHIVRPTHLKSRAKLLLKFVRIGGLPDFSFGVGKDPVLYSFTDLCARISPTLLSGRNFDRTILDDQSREYTSKD